MTIYLSMILSMSESLFLYLPCKTDMVFYQGTVSVISSDPPGHHSMMAIPIYNGTLKVFSDQVLEFYDYNFAYVLVLDVVYLQK